MKHHLVRCALSSLILFAVGYAALLPATGLAKDAPPKPHNVSWESARMDPAMEGRIERAVMREIEKGNLAGCVVLVGRRDGIVFEHAYGNRAVEPKREPMTTDTLFDMASVTKPVATATSIMILVARGQLRLSDKVTKFLPGF